jgi:hypothetical protein
MADDRLATGLLVEAKLRGFDRAGIHYYVVSKGAYFSGTILLKLNRLDGNARILAQITEGNKTVWQDAGKEGWIPESDADGYIARSRSRDPDIWVIEIETRTGENPWENN